MNLKAIIIATAVAVVAIVGGSVFITSGPQNENISYELGGGENSYLNPSYYGESPITLSNPSKNGYTFGGWYTDRGFTNEITTISPDMGKITLYASWILDVYTITYELNGGFFVENSPSTYSVEEKVVLSSPKSGTMTFNGWYTEQNLSARSKITDLNDMTGDLTLYAGYDTLVGKRYTYDLSGTANGLPVTGTLEVSYSDFKDGKYLLVEESVMIFATAGGTVNIPSMSSTWEENGFLRDAKYARAEVITYQGRQVVADVYEDTTGSVVGSDYLLPDNTVVKARLDGEIGGVMLSLIYRLSGTSEFTPKEAYDVVVHHGNGLHSVSGEGTFGIGEKVNLHATPDAGVSFKGWCDKDGNIYGNSKHLTIEAIGMDIELYAFCKGDVLLSTPTPDVYSNARWVIEGKYNGKYEATVYGDPVIYNIEDTGSYVCVFTGTAADGSTYTYSLDHVVDGKVRTTFEWKYHGQKYGMWWDTNYSYYAYYKELDTPRHHTTEEEDAKFVIYTNNTITRINEVLLEQTKDMSRLQRANFILAFVQGSIQYQYDKDGVG